MKTPPRGRREVEHTADLELAVWGPDMAALLEEAATGMYELMGLEVSAKPRRRRGLDITAVDREQLLVSFLEELLFLAQTEDLAFSVTDLRVGNLSVHASLEGGAVVNRCRDIKAVTYHGLEIRTEGGILRANVVFDV